MDKRDWKEFWAGYDWKVNVPNTYEPVKPEERKALLTMYASEATVQQRLEALLAVSWNMQCIRDNGSSLFYNFGHDESIFLDFQYDEPLRMRQCEYSTWRVPFISVTSTEGRETFSLLNKDAMRRLSMMLGIEHKVKVVRCALRDIPLLIFLTGRPVINVYCLTTAYHHVVKIVHKYNGWGDPLDLLNGNLHCSNSPMYSITGNLFQVLLATIATLRGNDQSLFLSRSGFRWSTCLASIHYSKIFVNELPKHLQTKRFFRFFSSAFTAAEGDKLLSLIFAAYAATSIIHPVDHSRNAKKMLCFISNLLHRNVNKPEISSRIRATSFNDHQKRFLIEICEYFCSRENYVTLKAVFPFVAKHFGES